MKRLVAVLLLSMIMLSACGKEKQEHVDSAVASAVEKIEEDNSSSNEDVEEEEKADIVSLYHEVFKSIYGDEIDFAYYLSDGKRNVMCLFNPYISEDRDSLFNELIIYNSIEAFILNSITKDVNSMIYAGMGDDSKAGAMVTYEPEKKQWYILAGRNRNGEMVAYEKPDWFVELLNVNHDEYEDDSEMKSRLEWILLTYKECFDKIE